jgi:putative phosphoribosyl transferase
MRFDDRVHAGRLLAERLERLREDHPVVLGLTRGGMPVAFEVARRLSAPLDVIVIQKIRARAEVPAGAVAEGGESYLNRTVAREGAHRQREAALADEEVSELARRVRLYRGATPAPRLEGRLVVVVDDFVATGNTARAASRAARARGARRVVLAVPAMSETLEPELGADFDEVVALEMTAAPRAPSDAYARLDEIDDGSALALLRRARLERAIDEIAPAAIS